VTQALSTPFEVVLLPKATSNNLYIKMAKPGINISKPAEKNEKRGVTIMNTPAKVAPVAPKSLPADAGTMRQQCEGSCFCECHLWFVQAVLLIVLTSFIAIVTDAFFGQHLWRASRVSRRRLLQLQQIPLAAYSTVQVQPKHSLKMDV